MGQEWKGMPCLRRFVKATLDVICVIAPPHVLDIGVRGGLLGTSFPELAPDFGSAIWFLPLPVTVDASAASIYDDDEMLCSTLGQQSTEVKEVTIRQI